MSNSFPSSLECKLKDDDIVYYLHIPKTAGTSFTATLDSLFDFDVPEEEPENEQNETKSVSKGEIISIDDKPVSEIQNVKVVLDPENS